ncbi:hypothetical protein WR25_21864 [Diploscapter pachys]|uniref:Transmembrane protein 14C n=1 Tax=Diploscapter pachys TaxID=2018661 RepID=A0A2A2M038_9BILA|nr:hypothetical protein WR25_21864 [Diploscapter pachys]
MPDVNTVNLAYAGLLAAGGIIGYIKAKSVPSLAAGLGSGMIVAFFTLHMLPFKSLVVSLVSGGLGYTMWKRYQRSGKFMPPGLIAGASAITLLVQILHICATKSFH